MVHTANVHKIERTKHHAEVGKSAANSIALKDNFRRLQQTPNHSLQMFLLPCYVWLTRGEKPVTGKNTMAGIKIDVANGTCAAGQPVSTREVRETIEEKCRMRERPLPERARPINTEAISMRFLL